LQKTIHGAQLTELVYQVVLEVTAEDRAEKPLEHCGTDELGCSIAANSNLLNKTHGVMQIQHRFNKI